MGRTKTEPVVSLSRLQGLWLHSHPIFGRFQVTGSDAHLDNQRGYLGEISVRNGHVAMYEYTASETRSTPLRIIWESPDRCVSWTRVPEAFEQMTVLQLKSNLRVLGLKVSGKKAELVKRIQACLGSTVETALPSQSVRDPIVPDRSSLRRATDPGGNRQHDNSPPDPKRFRTEAGRAEEDANDMSKAEAPERKYPWQPRKYEEYFQTIAGELAMSPIDDIQATLQSQLDELSEDAVHRVLGFLGYDPRDGVPNIDFVALDPLQRHAVAKVIRAERERRPIFLWGEGQGPFDAPEDVACLLLAHADNLLKCQFLNAMAKKKARSPREDRTAASQDPSHVDVELNSSILEGLSEEEG